MSESRDSREIEWEAAAFRRLRDHLRARADVQNIDLMNLAGFCRNCLADWYREAAEEGGSTMTKDESRVVFYGMPYAEWRERHQWETSPEAERAFSSSSRKS